MEDTVQTWNAIIPNYQITGEDLQKIKPMFLMEAIFELFDVLNIDGDKLIRHQLDQMNRDQFENLESFSALVPIINLSAAINFLLEHISRDVKKISFYDLLTPAPQISQNLLRVLLNYITFVSEQRENVIDIENKIQESAYDTEKLHKKKDELMEKADQICQEDSQRDCRIQQLENRIFHSKSKPVELEEQYKELDAKLKVLKQQYDSYVTDLGNDQIQHSTLNEEIIRLEKCIVNEEEEKDAHNAKEEAIQREQEVAQTLEEARSLIWQKEKIVKTLESNTSQIFQCQKMLNNLQKLYSVMNEMKSKNNPDSVEEEEKKYLEAQKEELMNRINSLKAEEVEWQLKMENSVEKVEMELKDIEIMDKEVDREIKNTVEKVSKLQNETNVLQNNITEYDKEREKLIKLYSVTIPSQYDNLIMSNINHIDGILDELCKFFKKNNLN